jgi:hypothetical protein
MLPRLFTHYAWQIVTRLRLLLLGVIIAPVLLNCRLTEDVDEGIDRRSDASKFSLGNLLDSTFRHQLMASFLNNSGLIAGSRR